MISRRRIILTGATGLVGKAVARQLAAQGYEIEPVPMKAGERLRFATTDRLYYRAVMAAWRAQAAVGAHRRHGVPDYRIIREPA